MHPFLFPHHPFVSSLTISLLPTPTPTPPHNCRAVALSRLALRAISCSMCRVASRPTVRPPCLILLFVLRLQPVMQHTMLIPSTCRA